VPVCAAYAVMKGGISLSLVEVNIELSEVLGTSRIKTAYQ